MSVRPYNLLSFFTLDKPRQWHSCGYPTTYNTCHVCLSLTFSESLSNSCKTSYLCNFYTDNKIIGCLFCTDLETDDSCSGLTSFTSSKRHWPWPYTLGRHGSVPSPTGSPSPLIDLNTSRCTLVLLCETARSSSWLRRFLGSEMSLWLLQLSH